MLSQRAVTMPFAQFQNGSCTAAIASKPKCDGNIATSSLSTTIDEHCGLEMLSAELGIPSVATKP